MPALAATPMTSKTTLALAALAEVILVRIALPGGATRAEMVRDLKGMTRPDLAPAAWRGEADAAIAGLVERGLATELRGRLKATPAGIEKAAAALGAPIAAKATWLELRDGPLTAKALGADAADKALVKALASPDGLRAMIVQRAFGLGDAKPMSHSKLRASLAVRALERAFGNQIKSGLGSGGGLASKPSRLLAGQLSKTPRDYGSDGRLIAALAAEHLGTANSEAETLRLALLRRHFRQAGEAEKAPKPTPAPTVATQSAARPAPLPPVANDPGLAGQRPLPAARPDLPGFIRDVQAAAARRADGWPGNRKAFISHVWEEIEVRHAAWALTEIEFKGMLAEAHRTGGLVLANADLKDKRHIQDFEKSAIQFRNMVLHFVRVEEK